jgi:hypothetical protein
MRLCRGRQQGPAGFCVIDREPDDDRDGVVDAHEAVRNKRLTLHLLEPVTVMKKNRQQEYL